MKVQKLVLVMMLVGLCVVFVDVAKAQNQSSDLRSFSESEALNMAQRWADLVSQADVMGLEKLLNDKYLHIHATALVESKAQFLEAFKNGTRKYDPIKIEEPTVRIFGSAAMVNGKFNLKAFTRGRTIESVDRIGLLLIKTENGSQVASFQATAIPQPK
jgi:hypothetical protein